LVEKPIALDRRGFAELRSTAQRSDRFLIENYNYLFNPPVQRILALIESGEFGDVVHVDAHFCSDILGKGSKHIDPNAPSPFHSLPGGPIVDFITHLAYLAHSFVGAHRTAHTAWANRSGEGSVRWDEFRALVAADRGTASLGFSAHAQPDVFSLRVHGTRMRATASLFEPLLCVERLRDGPPPLMPMWNGLSAARAYAGSAVSGLWGKLRGIPGTYAGLWALVRRLYEGLERGDGPPVTLEQIDAVNRLVQDLLAGAERT
jgi:predicted dehydrogenase